MTKRVAHRRVDLNLDVETPPRQNSADAHVENRAEKQRHDDAYGHVARGPSRLLGVSGDGVESDVREENYRRAREHAERLTSGVRLSEHGMAEEVYSRETVRRERVPVRWVHVERADRDDEDDNCDLEHDHRRVERRALADSDDEHDRHQTDDDHRREVEELFRRDEAAHFGAVVEGRAGERVGQADAEYAEQVLE